VFGLSSLVLGGLGTVGIQLPPLKLDKPQYYMMVGLALLVSGKKIISILAKVANTLK
jgi:hypothetical protein